MPSFIFFFPDGSLNERCRSSKDGEEAEKSALISPPKKKWVSHSAASSTLMCRSDAPLRFPFASLLKPLRKADMFQRVDSFSSASFTAEHCIISVASLFVIVLLFSVSFPLERFYSPNLLLFGVSRVICLQSVSGSLLLMFLWFCKDNQGT